MKSYICEIEKNLSVYPVRESKHHPESYVGGGQSKLTYIGLRSAYLKQTMTEGFTFSSKNPDQLAKIWDYIWWHSNCFEIMLLPLSWFYDSKQQSCLKAYWPMLKKWSIRIDNWAHADTLSGIYARILEEDSDLVYPTLVEWNSSKNPWLRRLSIVSLLYYSRQRKKVLPIKKILSLVKPQLNFDHHYVQKGVGWTLREAHSVYPNPTFEFIETNITKVSAHAFSAATEKMSPKQRKYLKRLRKR